MAIIVNVDVMLAKRKMSSGELAEKIGITPANLSILKTNKANSNQNLVIDIAQQRQVGRIYKIKE